LQEVALDQALDPFLDDQGVGLKPRLLSHTRHTRHIRQVGYPFSDYVKPLSSSSSYPRMPPPTVFNAALTDAVKAVIYYSYHLHRKWYLTNLENGP
jgi:hypothetical protein